MVRRRAAEWGQRTERFQHSAIPAVMAADGSMSGYYCYVAPYPSPSTNVAVNIQKWGLLLRAGIQDNSRYPGRDSRVI